MRRCAEAAQKMLDVDAPFRMPAGRAAAGSAAAPPTRFRRGAERHRGEAAESPRKVRRLFLPGRRLLAR